MFDNANVGICSTEAIEAVRIRASSRSDIRSDTLKLDWLSVRRAPVGLGPRFLAFGECCAFRQSTFAHESLERREPMVVITRAVVRLAARRRLFDLVRQGARPLLPSKRTLAMKMHDKREGLRLPGLGERRFVAFVQQRLEALQSLVFNRAQDNSPTGQCRRHCCSFRPRVPAPRSALDRDAAAARPTHARSHLEKHVRHGAA